MGQMRTALLFGSPEDIEGVPDRFWETLPEEIECTESGSLGIPIGIAHEDPELVLPLPLSEIESRYANQIALARSVWESFRDKSRPGGVEIPPGVLFLEEVERA